MDDHPATDPDDQAFGLDEAPAEERERLADAIADRLDVPTTAAGVVFLLLVVAETVTRPGGTIGTVFAVTSWVLWALFVLEFVVRLVVAPSAWGYLKKNWWQVLFLAVPALRFLRAFRALQPIRTARMGRVLSSAVRSGRSAGRKLSSRLASLGVVTVVVILAASQILFEIGGYPTYGEALYATAITTIGGAPLVVEDPAPRIIGLILVAYSVVVFATLAGSFGAFLLERSEDDRRVLRETT